MYLTGLLARLFWHFKDFHRKMYVVYRKTRKFCKNYPDFLVKTVKSKSGSSIPDPDPTR
jgi:hypothetical protein